MKDNKFKRIVDIALKGIGIAMGVAVVISSILGVVETKDAITMLAIGLICISLALLSDTQAEEKLETDTLV